MTIADTLRQLGRSAPDPRSDGELVAHFVAARDEPAFSELLRRHGPTVYGVCRRVLGNGPDVDDAFQAVFLVLARKASPLRTPGAVGPWLYGVAVRTANKARVMKAKAARREQRAVAGRAAAAREPSDPDALAVIDAELVALPDPYRAAFVACDLNGRTRSEAARELGWPEGTVAARVAKARQLLAARLRKRGVTPGVGLFAAVAVPTATASEALTAVRELLAVGTASAVAPAAQSLSVEVVKSMTTLHTKWLLLGGLALALGAGGAVLLATPGDTDPVRKLVKAPVPKAADTEWKEGKTFELDHPAPIRAVTFSPDGKTILVGQKSDVIAIDADNRKVRHTVLKIKEAEDQIFGLRYKPDGKRLGIANRNSYGLGGVEPKLGTSDYSTWAGQMTNVAFSPDGTRLAASDGRTVKVHSVPRMEKEVPIQFGPLVGGDTTKGDLPSPLAFSPKGDRLLSLPNFRVTADWTYDPQVGLKVDDPKAATHWVAVVWPLDGKEPTVLKHDKGRITSADWSADGKHIVTGDDKGTLFVWDGTTFEEKARLNLGKGSEPRTIATLKQLAIAPNGQTLAALLAIGPSPASSTAETHFELYLFNLTDPPAKPKPFWKTEKAFEWWIDGPASLAFSPDGKTLLAAFADPYNVANGGGKSRQSSGVRVWELVPKR